MSNQQSAPLSVRTAVLVAVFAATCIALGRVRTPLSQPSHVAPYPAYPRINTAVTYTIDEQWPRRPSGVTWGG